MGKGYKNASRALEVVNGIKTELLKVTRDSVKRTSMSAPSTDYDNGTVKRRRPSTWEDDSATIVGGSSADTSMPQDDTILNPSVNAIDSIFWSELTSLDFPGF